MSNDKAGQIGAWLAGTFGAFAEVVAVQLSQRTMRGNGEPSYSPIFRWLRSDGTAVDLGAAIVGAARIDAEDTEGTNRYAVWALTAKDEIRAKHEFRIDGKRTSGDTAPEESPTAAGLVAQAMRHQEVNAKVGLESVAVLTSSVGTVVSILERMLEKTQATVERMQAREERVIDMAERLTMNEHQRQIELMTATARIEMRTKALDKLEPLVPAVLAKLLKLPPGTAAALGLASNPAALGAGGPSSNVSPSIETGGADAMDGLLLSISESQLPALAGVLNDEQKRRLVQLFQAAKQREAAAAAASRGPNQPTTEAST